MLTTTGRSKSLSTLNLKNPVKAEPLTIRTRSWWRCFCWTSKKNKCITKMSFCDYSKCSVEWASYQQPVAPGSGWSQQRTWWGPQGRWPRPGTAGTRCCPDPRTSTSVLWTQQTQPVWKTSCETERKDRKPESRCDTCGSAVWLTVKSLLSCPAPTSPASGGPPSILSLCFLPSSLTSPVLFPALLSFILSFSFRNFFSHCRTNVLIFRILFLCPGLSPANAPCLQAPASPHQ